MSEVKEKRYLFKVKRGGHWFAFDFYYDNCAPPLATRQTWCTIDFFEQSGKKKVSETFGAARCSPSDNFCRSTGRKLALKRALLQLSCFLQSEFGYKPAALYALRKNAWEQYFNVCKK